MYSSKNEARISFLKKELDKVEMKEEDNMIEHLSKIQDLWEQLLNIDEVILDDDMISKTLASLPPLYFTFHTSLTLFLHGNPTPLTFEELVGLLLQEEQLRKNKSISTIAND